MICSGELNVKMVEYILVGFVCAQDMLNNRLLSSTL